MPRRTGRGTLDGVRFAGTASWQLRIDRWDLAADHALWLRAAERIDVPAGGIVPGPLADETPAPARPLSDPAAAATGWRAWWSAVVTRSDHEPGAAEGADAWATFRAAQRRPATASDALAPWPELAAAAESRTREFHAWHAARKTAGLQRLGPGDYRDGRVVQALEHRLGRTAPPFVVELLILPVLDDEIRTVRPRRHLVPERVYDARDWPDRLEPLLLPLFG